MPRPSLLSRYPLTLDHAVLLATAAADGEPALVVLLLDAEGVLLAVRHLDLTPAQVGEESETVVRLLARADPHVGPLVLASAFPAFGTDPEPVAGTWHELRRRLDALGTSLLDWLLVDDRGVTSVRRALEGPAPDIWPVVVEWRRRL